MEVMDIIKNPVVIGLTAGFITYLYIKWRINKELKNTDKYNKKTDVNLLIPFAVFVVFWFITYAYFNTDEKTDAQSCNITLIDKKTDLHIPKSQIDLENNQVFKVVTNGVQIPNTLPEILFEMN